MTVYVDTMRARVGRLILCHMLSDDDGELDAMADRIGVARRWRQDGHYDVCLAKRALAIAAGAVEITWRQAGAMQAVRRRTGRLPVPALAVGLLRSLRRAGP